MLAPKNLLSVGFLKKQPLCGSHRGMRYRLLATIKDDAGEDIPPERQRLYGWIWPQPYCFEAADREAMITGDWPFTPEGVAEAGQWIDSTYEKNRDSGMFEDRLRFVKE